MVKEMAVALDAESKMYGAALGDTKSFKETTGVPFPKRRRVRDTICRETRGQWPYGQAATRAMKISHWKSDLSSMTSITLCPLALLPYPLSLNAPVHKLSSKNRPPPPSLLVKKDRS